MNAEIAHNDTFHKDYVLTDPDSRAVYFCWRGGDSKISSRL